MKEREKERSEAISYTQNSSRKWGYLCVSVGDCKAFVYRNRTMFDVTAENRGNANNPTDPGKESSLKFPNGRGKRTKKQEKKVHGRFQ